MLKLLLITPLLGILPLTLIKTDSSTKTALEIERTNSLMKQIALATSLITLLISILL